MNEYLSEMIIFAAMKAVKNILFFAFFVIMTYGLVGSKSIAYCCGNCHVVEKPTDEKKNCCASEKQGQLPHNHDCKGDPCRVAYLQYDWSPTVTTAIALASPVFDLFYSAQSLSDFCQGSTVALYSKKQEPPPVVCLPREYLSFLRILII